MKKVRLTPVLCAEIMHKAHRAGMLAASTCVVQPMHIKGYAPVEDGVCGFASVEFKGNTVWGRWALKAGIAKRHVGRSGAYIWISAYNQSHTKKLAYATAYAKVLNEYGIRAWTEDRLD